MVQLELIDGGAARDDGMRRAAEHCPDEWKDQAFDLLVQLCLKKSVVTSEDLWAAGLPKPHEPRAIGPVFVQAAREGYITRTGSYNTSRLASRHAAPIAVWRSLVYSPPEER